MYEIKVLDSKEFDEVAKSDPRYEYVDENNLGFADRLKGVAYVRQTHIHDLNKYPYPIESNSFDKVFAKHIIEHLNDPGKFIEEIHRILKPGGTAFFETPHFSSYVAYSEPQHKFFFSYFMFTNLIRHLPFKVLKQEITFYKTFRFFGIKALANRFPRGYERFWTFIFPAENVVLLVEKK